MAATAQQNGRTEDLKVIKASGEPVGDMRVTQDGTTLEFAASISLPALPGDSPEASTGSSDSAASESTGSSTNAEPSETFPSPTSPSSSSDNKPNIDSSDSSDQGSNVTSTESSSGGEETETEESSADSETSTDTTKNDLFPASIQNQQELEKWIAERQEGLAQTPDKPIRQIELVSWLQVPEILRALSKNEGPLRITYPDCSDTNITAEQQAIRKFLVEGAGEDLKDLTGKLEEKIKNCHFVTTGIVTEQVAQAYRTSIALENSSTTKLTVAEVIRTNEHFIPNRRNRQASRALAAVNGRELILGAITNAMDASTEFHTFIIEVPEEHRDVAKLAFADYYKKLDEEQKPDAQYTKVWVLPSRDSTKDIEESSFLDFIKNPPDMGMSRKKKSSSDNPSSSRLQLVEQQLGNPSN